MGRQQVLRHLMRRKRHFIIKPPGDKTERGSRDKLGMHGYWNGEMLLMGRGQFAHFGRNLFCNIVLDQLLEPADPLSAQHELVELLMLRRMLEQTNKIGRRMLYRERAGWHMLFFCH